MGASDRDEEPAALDRSEARSCEGQLEPRTGVARPERDAAREMSERPEVRDGLDRPATTGRLRVWAGLTFGQLLLSAAEAVVWKAMEGAVGSIMPGGALVVRIVLVVAGVIDATTTANEGRGAVAKVPFMEIGGGYSLDFRLRILDDPPSRWPIAGFEIGSGVSQHFGVDGEEPDRSPRGSSAGLDPGSVPGIEALVWMAAARARAAGVGNESWSAWVVAYLEPGRGTGRLELEGGGAARWWLADFEFAEPTGAPHAGG